MRWWRWFATTPRPSAPLDMAPRPPGSTSPTGRAVASLLGGATRPSTRPAWWTRRAPTRDSRWPTRRSRHSPAPGKAYLQISGPWIYGQQHVDRRRVAYRRPRAGGLQGADRTPASAAEALPRGVVITSGVADGDGGGGFRGSCSVSPRDDDGNLIMLGSGQQHWDTVHAADLAEVFRRAPWKTTRSSGPLRRHRRTEPDRGRDHRGGRRCSRRPG